MKKVLLTFLFLLICLSTVACGKKTDAEIFKKEYETINGAKDANGNIIRTVSIPEDNPFIYQTADELADRIDKKETFVVYFGFAECPWCRSMIEQLLKSAQDNNIKTIYYVDVKDIRDEFEISESEGVVQTNTGTNGYNRLLDQLDNVLDDYYVLNDKDQKVNTKEKRIYAPNVVAIVNGKAEKLVEGLSADLKDPYAELTEEMKTESYDSFKCIWECYTSDSNTCQKSAC